MAKRIIIGGGKGFIGRYLTWALVAQGHKVLTISRASLPDTVTWKQIEKNGFPKQVDAVVNCAGEPMMNFKRWSYRLKHAVTHSRVETTKILARAINEAPVWPEVFVLVTFVGAYPPSEFNIYDEDSCPTGMDFFSSLVLEMEHAAKVDFSVRMVSIRTGAVIGRSGGIVKWWSLPFKLGVGGRIGSGQQYMPWIHVLDLTRLILFAINNEEVRGVLNGVAPQIVTNEEFFSTYAAALKKPACMPVPEGVANLLLGSERAKILTRGQCVVPRRVQQLGFEFQYPRLKEAFNECFVET